MNFPLITLQPGGPRPPTPTQKANILAILGAAAANHNHQDLTDAIAALNQALSNYALANHTHQDLTDAIAALNQALGNYALSNHTHQDLTDAIAALNQALSNHTHQDLVDAIAALNQALNNYALVNHTHPELAGPLPVIERAEVLGAPSKDGKHTFEIAVSDSAPGTFSYTLLWDSNSETVSGSALEADNDPALLTAIASAFAGNSAITADWDVALDLVSGRVRITRKVIGEVPGAELDYDAGPHSSTIAFQALVESAGVGQLLRYGDADPFYWYVATGESAWLLISSPPAPYDPSGFTVTTGELKMAFNASNATIDDVVDVLATLIYTLKERKVL